MTGYIESVYLIEDIIEADGFLPLEKYQSITSLGIDGYYQTERIKRLPYAKP